MPLHPGRIAKERTILGVRELVREDLSLLREKRAALPAVARFRDPHHRLARLFAMGLRKKDVVLRSGFSLARIQTIYADPAFQELVASYRNTVDEAFKEEADEFFEQATSNMRMAERQLAEKLEEAEENNELLPTKDLIAIVADRADRFGYGKHQTNLNVNVDFAAQLEKAIKRSGKTIDITPSTVAPSNAQVPMQTTSLESTPRLAEPQPLLRRA